MLHIFMQIALYTFYPAGTMYHPLYALASHLLTAQASLMIFTDWNMLVIYLMIFRTGVYTIMVCPPM